MRIYGPGDLPVESPTVRTVTSIADELEAGLPLTEFSREVVIKALDLSVEYLKSKNL